MKIANEDVHEDPIPKTSFELRILKIDFEKELMNEERIIKLNAVQ